MANILYLCLRAVVVALSLTAAVGCSNATGEDAVDFGPVGSIGLRLKLPSGTTLDLITYTITGPTMKSGTIPATGMGSTFSVIIDNLKSGAGYTITLDSKQSNGAKDCFGSQSFAVMSNVTASVQVRLSCPGVRNGGSGSVIVNGAVNICATVDSAVASPIGDGSMISLSGSGSDDDGLPSNRITYSWTAPAGSGSFDDASSVNTKFQCMTNGAVTLTLADTDTDCGDAMGVTVACKEPGTCTPMVERVCNQANPHWKDSCGNIDNSPIENCDPGLGCAAGFCLSGPVDSITMGYAFACALTGRGALKCWGDNFHGQLGNGSYYGQLPNHSPVPVPVTGLTSGVTAVSAGRISACAVVSGGLRCWGDDYWGVLGTNTALIVDVPEPVTGLASGVTAVSVGGRVACAVVSGGLQCWGDNYFGQLGNGTTTYSPVRVPVMGLTSGVTAFAVGSASACAVVSGGLQCWGDNEDGQLGNGSGPTAPVASVPEPVTGLTSGVTALAAGTASACAVVSRALQCWGDNNYGELGDGTATDSPVPVPVIGLTSGVTAVSVGDRFACAVVSGGVQCWGDNHYGELGNGTTTDSPVPVPVTGLTSGVSAIAAGGFSACAVVLGRVQCWGRNDSGQLGNGSTTDSLVPVQVMGL